ncbi:hypothetical protein B0H14DRAFT_3475142 [Mycena olivaceomarginata]|nr:hypothetical protein B0H14DRAFT_3475142 [Mycena olivaceomarginata]
MAPPATDSDSDSDETSPVLGVVDLAADNNNNDWEDEDNPPTRAWYYEAPRVVGAKRTADEETILTIGHQQGKEQAQELAVKYGMKVKEVRHRLHASSAFKTRRKVSLYNAKISALMARLNEDRDIGRRFTMPDIKQMVKADPSMLEGFLKEEEKKMVSDIRDKRDRKRRGARANNLAASADAKRTVERLMEEITGLAERSGMIGFAMFTRGHIHDSSIPITMESWGALSFFWEVLKKDPADVSALFELWAVSHARGKPPLLFNEGVHGDD